MLYLADAAIINKHMGDVERSGIPIEILAANQPFQQQLDADIPPSSYQKDKQFGFATCFFA